MHGHPPASDTQSSGGDYWKLVDEKLEEIRDTVKDPAAITQCVRLTLRCSDDELTISVFRHP